MEKMDQDCVQSNGSTPPIKRKCGNCKRCQISREKIQALHTTLAELEAKLSEAKAAQKKDDTTRIPTATQAALQNSVVMSTILKKVPSKSLPGLRLVCKAWEDEATFLLLSDTTSFTPYYVWTYYSPHDNMMGKNGVGSLGQLTKLIRAGKEAGRRFPSSHFGFVCSNLVVCPQLTQFFMEHGQIIHNLSLVFSEDGEIQREPDLPPPSPPPSNTMIMDFLRNILFKWAPNVRQMFIGGIPWPDESESATLFGGDFPQGSVTLPNLQILRFRRAENKQSKRFIQELMTAAPNLKTEVDPSSDSTKAGAGKELRCSLGWKGTGLTKLQLQAAHFKKLNGLVIGYTLWERSAPYPTGWEPQVELLNQILENNKDTLTKITAGPLAFLPGLCIPPMTKVKVLSLSVTFRNYYKKVPNLSGPCYFRLFPRWLDLEKSFPNVSILSISSIWRTNDHYRIWDIPESYLIPALLGTEAGRLPSVKTVVYKCRGSVPDLLIKPLARLVPNVVNFHVHYDDRKSNRLPTKKNSEPQPFPLLRAIWKHFPDIQHLVVSAHNFDLKLSPKFFERNVFCMLMDSWVTGLDVEAIRRLRNSSSGERGLDDPETMKRSQLSIFDMKNLKYLEVAIDGVSPLFSFISATHGFHLKKNLQVVCQVKGQGREIFDDPRGLMEDAVQVVLTGQ